MKRLFFGIALSVLGSLAFSGNANAATTLISGTTISDSFEVINDVDTYEFTGDAGDYVHFQLHEDLYHNGQIYVYGTDGSLKTSGNHVVGLTLPDTGSYTVQVKMATGATGDYIFEYFNSNDAVENGSLVSGTTLTGIFERTNDFDTYEFTGDAGDYVHFQLHEDLYHNGQIYVYGTDGSLKTSAYHVAGLTLPDTGRYTVLVKMVTGASGDYNLEYFNSTEAVESGSLVSGTTLTGIFERTNDFDTYEFTGDAGDYVHFQLHEDLYHNGQIYVYGTDGSLKTSGNHVVGLTLPDTGRYTVLVKMWAGVSGDYNLEYFNSTEAVENGFLIDEVSISGIFERTNDFDTYKFTGDWSDSIYISVSESLYGIAQIYVYHGVNGNLVKYGTSAVNFTLSEGTHYTVLVKMSSGASGDYTIYYNTTPFLD